MNAWVNFYLIVGGAAGALIGLQFVVVTLIADRPALRIGEAGAAFATPTIVHFATILVVSALATAPWQGLTALSAIWSLVGLVGLVYSAFVVRHLRRQTVYRPVFEDWCFNVALPVAAYVLLLVAGMIAQAHARAALFTVGAAMITHLLVGIHNAWDSVTYHVFVQRAEEDIQEPKGRSREAS